ncbi:MAG: hypothetical protein GY750_03925 [Lentisphaerae bacterium]|nr:hypothetical protein [Lentisphaerota bacterium]MCP4100562.1 hypothetical protein [Lentisphaerota bacterium]
MELKECTYSNWPNCLELSNNLIKLVITLNVGPRVVFFGFKDSQNLFKNFENQIGTNGRGKWLPYGGHRLWHAPEKASRTYCPDNSPVDYSWDGKTLTLNCPEEKPNQIRKVIEIEINEITAEVNVNHKIYNTGNWAKELAAWCLTVMAAEGRAIIPQEPFVPHGINTDESLAPARPLVMWQFTKMDDPRFTWGNKFIQMREGSAVNCKQKIGLLNKQGWAAYYLNGEAFVKKQEIQENAVYPDYGSSMEFYTEPGFLEIESLSPLVTLNPGECVEHLECWQLFKCHLSKDEDEVEAKLLPLIKE